MAIITADSDDEALKMGRLALCVAIIVSCVLWMILFFGGQTVTSLMGAEGLGNLVVLLPLALLSVAVQNVSDYQAARLGVFRLVGIVSVLQALVTNLARVLGGLWSPVAAILITVTTLAPAVKSAMLMLGSQGMRRRAPALTKPDAFALLNKYRDFPIYRMPSDVLNAVSQNVPVLLFAALFSPVAAGFYVLSRTVLNAPYNIISAALGNVLYARFAEISRDRKPLMPLMLRSTAALIAFAPIIVGPSWFAPELFAFVFGEEWREAGHYAFWMALWISVGLATTPAIRLSPIVGAQKVLLLFSFIVLIARFLSVYVVYFFEGDARQSVMAFCFISVASNFGVYAIVASKTLHQEMKKQEFLE